MKTLATICAFLCATSAFANSLSCEDAYKKAKSSPSIADVMAATDLCERATEDNCNEVVGDIDDQEEGRFTQAICEMVKQWGANRAANKGKLSSKCEKAVQTAEASPSILLLNDASGICAAMTQDICAKAGGGKNDRSGDARLIRALCVLDARFGGFQATLSLME